MAERFRNIEDSRQEVKVDYSVHDCLMSAFAMMFFQDPSMLAFQRRLEQTIQQNNLRALFQVTSIPKDTQLRDVLDPLPNESIDNKGKVTYRNSWVTDIPIDEKISKNWYDAAALVGKSKTRPLTP